MSNVLKKITTRAKQLKKRNPGKKWKTLVKQAGAEYRSGKLKTTRKRKPTAKRKPAKRKPATRRVASKKVGTVKRRRVRRRSVAKKPRVVTQTRVRTKTVIRRVGSKKSKLSTLLLIGGALAVGYMLLKRPAPQAQYIPTANPSRNNLAADILTYVTAAGMTATAVMNLIKTMNSSNDAQIQKIYDNVKSGADPYANVAGIGYGKAAVNVMQ